jgi:hypothetical protein
VVFKISLTDFGHHPRIAILLQPQDTIILEFENRFWGRTGHQKGGQTLHQMQAADQPNVLQGVVSSISARTCRGPFALGCSEVKKKNTQKK